MTRQRTKKATRPKGPAPANVVLAAYTAANQGRYRTANGLVAREFRTRLLETHAETVKTGRALRRMLAALEGKRGDTARSARKTLRALIESNRELVGLRVGSARFLEEMWDAATRHRSVLTITAMRQVVRGSKARVRFTMTLRDGTVVKDGESLVRDRGRWRLG
jgi:hypothetical protein